MTYQLIEYRHEVLDEAVLDGKHYHDVALVLQQRKYSDSGEDTFRPVIYDAEGELIWAGAISYSCLEGISQLGELLERLVYAARRSAARREGVVASPTDSQGRPTRLHG